MGKRVLVVDDDPDFLALIRVALSRAGHDVICAHHGKDAVDKLKIRIPDIVVSDVIMPVMDGVDLFQELKKNEETRNLPVIMMSIKESLEKIFRAAGADDFLTKPFEPRDLIQRIEGRFDNRLRTSDAV